MWDTFKMSFCNIIREIFLKTKVLTLRPTNFSTNTQSYVASTKVPCGAKTKNISAIAHHTAAPLRVQEIGAKNMMFILQEKGNKQYSRNTPHPTAVIDA